MGEPVKVQQRHIRVLAMMPGTPALGIRPMDVSEELAITRGNASRILYDLCEWGLADHSGADGHRRYWRTSKGAARAAAAQTGGE